MKISKRLNASIESKSLRDRKEKLFSFLSRMGTPKYFDITERKSVQIFIAKRRLVVRAVSVRTVKRRIGSVQVGR